MRHLSFNHTILFGMIFASLFELDYQTIHDLTLAGIVLTILLPALTIYFLQRNTGMLFYRLQEADADLINQYASVLSNVLNWACKQNRLLTVRRKESPDESDEAFLSLMIN
ncbi:hypothetical protein [Cytobacillus sp. FSL K6-0265]|uniref:hypothetical protein n=1 Tax=Cytobacillus sp. FSL K6-0265 TaxID=2921448 RepID=UPI0030FB86BE